VITKTSTIGEILDLDESTAQFFMEMGMFCFGCPAAREESLEEACAVHGVDSDEMVQRINEHLAVKKQ
jgi:hybrid cluster-associated redox disulfide protein